AGVLNTTSFVVLMSVQLLAAFYMLFGQQKKKALLTGISLTLIFLAFLWAAIPSHSYEEALGLVQSNSEQSFENLNLTKQTIPAEKSSGWFLNKKLYYFVSKNKEGTEYYAVDPVKGEPIELDEAYW